MRLRVREQCQLLEGLFMPAAIRLPTQQVHPPLVGVGVVAAGRLHKADKGQGMEIARGFPASKLATALLLAVNLRIIASALRLRIWNKCTHCRCTTLQSLAT